MGYYGTDVDPPQQAQKKWWSVLAWPLWGLLALIVVFAALFLAPLRTRIDFGGILGWLLGKSSPERIPSVATAGAPPPLRHTQPGSADARGQVQAPVAPIKPTWNPWARKDEVKLPSGQKVALPDGVHRDDVSEVIHVTPKTAIVRVRPDSPSAVVAHTHLSSTQLLAKLQEIQAKKEGRR